MGMWSRSKGWVRLGCALINSFRDRERARESFLEEVISELGFAV